MPPKYIYNHIALFDGETWKIFRKLDKRIPKKPENYGDGFLVSSESLEIALEKAQKLGIPKYDVQVFTND